MKMSYSSKIYSFIINIVFLLLIINTSRISSTANVSAIPPMKFLSNYEKLNLWMNRFNRRFQPILKICLRSKCQCLGDLDHIATIANVTSVINNKTSQERLNLDQRRRLATILLTNVIRLDGFHEKKPFDWFQCKLSEDTICPDLNDIPNSYYEENRLKLLSLLMPDFVRNETLGISIFSFEFVQNLDDLLRRLNRNLASQLPSNSAKLQSWFGRENLLNDLDRFQDSDSLAKVEVLALLIVNRLVKGENIELFESRFLRDIISRYGPLESSPSTSSVFHIDQYGLAKFLNDLHIGGLIEPVSKDDQQKSITNKQQHDSIDFNEESSVDNSEQDQQQNIRHTDRRSLYHKHKINFPTLSNELSEDESKLSLSSSSSYLKPFKDGECLNYMFYLNRLKQNSDQNKNFITEQDIQHLAPIFLQQIVSKACERIDNGVGNGDGISIKSKYQNKHYSDNDNIQQRQIIKMSDSSQPDKILIGHFSTTMRNAKIIYSNLAVLAISFCSLFGILLIPFLKTRTFSLVINMLIGLAYGSMSSDALFHLIPAVLGLHKEEEEEEEHTEKFNLTNSDHNNNHHEHHGYLQLMLLILISIYFLFLFEVFSNAIAKHKDKMRTKKLSNKKRETEHGHEHYHHHRKMDHQLHHYQKHKHHGHHHLDHNEKSDSSSSLSSELSTITMNVSPEMKSSSYKSQTPTESRSSNKIEDSTSNLSSFSSNSTFVNNKNKEKEIICLGMTSLALIITLSDSIHNLLDGVAIGISFSSSISRGLSTSLAVFCHELPHEFGDFAVMLSTGMSVRRAAIINFISALTSFIGLYIGLLLGSSETANRWALAVCAGLFLYISLCDMLPELKEMIEPIFSKQWFLAFFMKNFGIILGYVCMVLVALYEDQINFA